MVVTHSINRVNIGRVSERRFSVIKVAKTLELNLVDSVVLVFVFTYYTSLEQNYVIMVEEEKVVFYNSFKVAAILDYDILDFIKLHSIG